MAKQNFGHFIPSFLPLLVFFDSIFKSNYSTVTTVHVVFQLHFKL